MIDDAMVVVATGDLKNRSAENWRDLRKRWIVEAVPHHFQNFHHIHLGSSGRLEGEIDWNYDLNVFKNRIMRLIMIKLDVFTLNLVRISTTFCRIKSGHFPFQFH